MCCVYLLFFFIHFILFFIFTIITEVCLIRIVRVFRNTSFIFKIPRLFEEGVFHKTLGIDELRRLYKTHWRPDEIVFIVSSFNVEWYCKKSIISFCARNLKKLRIRIDIRKLHNFTITQLCDGPSWYCRL